MTDTQILPAKKEGWNDIELITQKCLLGTCINLFQNTGNKGQCTK